MINLINFLCFLFEERKQEIALESSLINKNYITFLIIGRFFNEPVYMDFLFRIKNKKYFNISINKKKNKYYIIYKPFIK